MEADIPHLLKCGMEWDLESAGLSHQLPAEEIDFLSFVGFFPLDFLLFWRMLSRLDGHSGNAACQGFAEWGTGQRAGQGTSLGTQERCHYMMTETYH